ncbi:MAG: toxic anion resistance protein, partial [Tetrasphaera sp.]|nr:toxic anion resistance protein [Tetrasphaera sp.]
KLDAKLAAQIATLDATDPEKAKALREDVLFYVRQKHQDLLTQLAVSIQNYLAIDIVIKNNIELIKGVDRATTTTISALRTAVIVSQALSNQQLVLDQITALNTTTSGLIERTSEMLKDNSIRIQEQAASATIGLPQLQRAFQNIYATMDAIDTFKVQALDNMAATIGTLETEVAKSRSYLDRVQRQDQRVISGSLDIGKTNTF